MTSRTSQPFPSDTVMVTDAGLETWLVFDHGMDLPAFAAYPLAASADGRARLEEYYRYYADIAASVGAGCVLEAATWRANPDWAATLGHDRDALAELIAANVEIVDGVRREWNRPEPFLVSAAIGPRGDGYVIDEVMTADAAAEYHGFQIGCVAATRADLVTAMTIGYVDEAIGIVRAARDQDMPVVISFTVETDGRLPSGTPLGEAIEAVDAATDGYALHFMINCAHPSHFDGVLDSSAPWSRRVRGIRANASTLSHAELDEMEVLDSGDPVDLAARYVRLRDSLPKLVVVGGCCGTDHRHVEQIARTFALS